MNGLANIGGSAANAYRWIVSPTANVKLNVIYGGTNNLEAAILAKISM